VLSSFGVRSPRKGWKPKILSCLNFKFWLRFEGDCDSGWYYITYMSCSTANYVHFFSFHRLLSFVLFLLNIMSFIIQICVCTKFERSVTINLDFCLLTINWIDNLSSIRSKSLQTINFLCSIETHAQQPFCF